MNTSKTNKEINFSKYLERTKGFSKARSVTGNETYATSDKITVPEKNMVVLELIK
jgi:hypothetical protein